MNIKNQICLKVLLYAFILLNIANINAQSRYEIPCKEYLLSLRMDSLKAQVGTKEKTGRNDGDVEKYQKPFGLLHVPYCKLLQDWAFYVNLKALTDAPYKFNPLAISIYQIASKKGIKTKYAGFRGDLIVWKNKGNITGHIECIEIVFSRGWVQTIAGNTSNGKTGNQREGNGVYRRQRNIKHPLSRILQIYGIVGFRK